MLITFSCPECKAELEVGATAAGSQVLCPQCSKTLTVPRKGPGPGVTIGQFQILKLLGKGGMGEVYLARQLSLGRDIALKILPAGFRDQKERVERFFKEVKLLARLDHPNIIMAHEAGEDEGILYLAMSYVSGESLEKRLQHNGPMAEADALKLIDTLAGALDYAWRNHHLLHRDIKPANILLTADGNVKLTDFGLAKCLDEAANLTLSGDIIGSPNYMSPEQVDNAADMDCRSDMYSVGTTLYHVLTGKLPFAGSSLMETLKKQLSESLPDPRLERPEISEACVLLLEIMLAKDRRDRHADYPTLRADIARVRAGDHPTKSTVQPGESMLLRQVTEPTVQRSKFSLLRSKPSLKKTMDRGLPWATGILMGLAAAIGLAVIFGRSSPRASKPLRPPENAPEIAAVTSAPVAVAPAATSAPVPVPPPATPPPAVDDGKAGLNEKCLEAMKYMREHPEDLAGAQRLLVPLREESKGTEWEDRIVFEFWRIVRAQRQAAYHAVALLRTDVRAQLDQNNVEGALRRLEQDTGPATEEMKAARLELMLEIRAKKQALAEVQAKQAEAAARAKLTTLAQELAGDLLKGDTAALTRRLSEARADTGLGILSNEVSDLESLALQAANWPEQAAKSFDEKRGKTVTVEFKDGRTERFLVEGIAGQRISGRLQVPAGYVGREFSVRELSTGEKLKRLGNDSRPAVKLMRGLVLVQYANDWAAAEKEFASGGMLGEALARQAPARALPSEVKTDETSAAGSPKPTSDKAVLGPKDILARKALSNLLKLADVSTDLSDPQGLADTIRRKEFSSSTVSKINDALADFNKQYGQTETAKAYAAILSALANANRYLPPPARPFRSRWTPRWRPLL